MKSYIKIYGPPIGSAIKALEKISIDMHEVCIMSTDLAISPPMEGEPLANYFGGLGEISEQRCGNIISKSRESLGEYDFFFEWFKKPTMNDLHALMEKVDDALTEVGVRYTITTK